MDELISITEIRWLIRPALTEIGYPKTLRVLLAAPYFTYTPLCRCIQQVYWSLANMYMQTGKSLH